MKALFIRCNGKLAPDMLGGGLIDMGVPPAYLRTKLEAAGVSSAFIIFTMFKNVRLWN